jgi:FkbM family methyltransferase
MKDPSVSYSFGVTTADDQPFRHYTTRHLITAWVSQRLFDNLTYTVRHGLLKDMKRRGGLGWLPESVARKSESSEQAFWRNLNLKGMVVYDVGAFEGLLTLYFARQARTVVSYEPNTRNHSRLVENLRLNGTQNVLVRKVGVASEAHMATMVTDPLMAGGASVETNTVKALRSSNQPVVSENIAMVRLDDDIGDQRLPAPDFIKIDIEGEELAALKGARATIVAHRPQLFLEMHGETMNLKRKKVKEIVAYLDELGYRNIQHLETGSAIGRDNAETAVEGHLYCLARPAEFRDAAREPVCAELALTAAAG